MASSAQSGTRGRTALEILEPDPNLQPPFLSYYTGPAIGCFLGGGASLFANWSIKKPLMAGVHVHIMLALTGLGLGYYFDQKRAAYLAKRDAILRHYIQLHPEDFIMPEQKKIGELFQPWTPIR